jgi:hypothetical protein
MGKREKKKGNVKGMEMGLVEWLKWQSSCLARLKLSSNPSTTQNGEVWG